jgi:hypothetical protein
MKAIECTILLSKLVSAINTMKYLHEGFHDAGWNRVVITTIFI